MRSWLWRWVRFFLFRVDAEKAHRATVVMIRMADVAGGLPLRLVSGTPARPVGGPTVFGLPFCNRVGLAAGFDKDAELTGALPSLGFGFAEIGTVTPLAQPGNPRPRLFRDPQKDAVFNRMGFNGLGAEVVSTRLRAVRPRLPVGFQVGVNLGKNKETPVEKAPSDYARAAAAFEGLADYLVINVSSPNTPGLRAFQTVEGLKPLVEAVQETTARWTKRPPLLLKLAPELKDDALTSVLEAGAGWGVDGWVLTNTLGGTWPGDGGVGGWSGTPVREASRLSLKLATSATRLPIISVGGILDPEEAAERIRLGAALVQLYSGWILRGPALPSQVARRLAADLA